MTAKPGIYWMGFHQGGFVYPKYCYHTNDEPRLVNDESEEKQAKLDGFEPIEAGVASNKAIANWIWDFEDMSPRQLCIYAKEEYGVELPGDAPQEKLLMAVLELGKHAPQNQGRMVLMAHTMKMNYDETLDQIRRGIAGGVTDMITEEFVA